MANIKPLPNYVLIEEIEDDNQTKGGIYRPDTAKDKPAKGKIIAIGKASCKCAPKGYRGIFSHMPDCDWLKAEELVEGNIIAYKRWAGQEIKDEGKTYQLLAFSDLLAIYE